MNFSYLPTQTLALGIELEMLTPHMGVIIHGLQLSESNSPKIIQYVENMLAKHKVLFFRNQKQSTESFQQLAQNFGPIQIHPFNRSGSRNTPGVIRVYHNKENKSSINTWHSDATWRKVLPYATFIRCLKCPSTGGDTMFANMEAAYESLSDSTKNKIENLYGIHYITHFRNRMEKEGFTKEQIDAYDREFSPSVHPMVTINPNTGKKVLFVNEGYTIGIQGMEEKESKALLEELYKTVKVPEFQCRFKWEKNSLAIWDNRVTQHYPISDYWPEDRLMERIVVSCS